LQDYKGAPPKKMLKQAQFKDQHFEEDRTNLVFKYLTKDIVTKQEIIQKITYDKPNKSILDQLKKVRSSADDPKKVRIAIVFSVFAFLLFSPSTVSFQRTVGS
jgi:hypothetical protein